ncbi:hypothetical protein HOC37_03015 [bacterium]|jgi:hypothetical protein|nr:hypothetical protein [bacterium]
MKLNKIIKKVTDKDKFLSIVDYADFCMFYLEYIKNNLQAVIVSRNENNYRFFQYNKQGTYNITRPINSDLMFSIEEFLKKKEMFFNILNNIRDKNIDTVDNRKVINNFVYTCQQSIGASLDALPANRSNTARKINGDLFERFIRLILNDIGLNVTSSTVAIPVKIDGEIAFNMNYQHDLLIQVDKNIKAIGSVKTSSKDRLDKIFIDKFLYNRLTDSETPHFAVFLNDVQRKGKEGKYGINATFLPGHFKGYTIKLNPLDGVYYFDIRPNMRTENILKDHIKTFDNFLINDVWKFITKNKRK